MSCWRPCPPPRRPSAPSTGGYALPFPGGGDRITPEALTPHTVTSEEGVREVVAATAERGYAWVEQELEEGLRSLAAPVVDGTGRVVAAVNVALHAGRATPEESLAALLPHLGETAARIGADVAAVSRFSPVVTG
ncbi:IclR family transcriptional regulator domain-containing protein [Streptomyces sp. NPDC001056]